MGPPMSSLILLASRNPWAPGACVCFCPGRLGPVSPEDGGVNRWEPVCRPLEAIITLLGNLIYLKRRVLILANSLSGLCVKWRGGAGLNHLTASAFLLGSWNLCGDQGRAKGHCLGLGDQAPTFLAATSPGILKMVPLYLVIWYKPHIAAFPAQPGGASNSLSDIHLTRYMHWISTVCSRAPSPSILTAKRYCYYSTHFPGKKDET